VPPLNLRISLAAGVNKPDFIAEENFQRSLKLAVIMRTKTLRILTEAEQEQDSSRRFQDGDAPDAPRLTKPRPRCLNDLARPESTTEVWGGHT
jgi:hypothetical protein